MQSPLASRPGCLHRPQLWPFLFCVSEASTSMLWESHQMVKSLQETHDLLLSDGGLPEEFQNSPPLIVPINGST